MDSLRERIDAFFRDLEYTELKKIWVEKLIDTGFDAKEARVWAAEIGHVVDEYQSTLRGLAKVLEETDSERIPERVCSWAVGITEVTVPEIEEPMIYLQKQLEKYIPPDENEDNLE